MSSVKNDTSQAGLKLPDLIFSDPAGEVVQVVNSLLLRPGDSVEFYMRELKVGGAFANFSGRDTFAL
jgi:hypothetical protein